MVLAESVEVVVGVDVVDATVVAGWLLVAKGVARLVVDEGLGVVKRSSKEDNDAL